MNRNYLPVWLALGALLIAVLLAIGVEPPPLPSAPAPKTVSVMLAWDRSPDTNVTRYRVYWGPAKRSYTNYIETPLTTLSIPGLTLPQYFAATAVAADGLESEFSAEVGGMRYFVVRGLSATNISGPWDAWSNMTEVVLPHDAVTTSLFLRVSITNEWR